MITCLITDKVLCSVKLCCDDVGCHCCNKSKFIPAGWLCVADIVVITLGDVF
jgi:hypothetical protein